MIDVNTATRDELAAEVLRLRNIIHNNRVNYDAIKVRAIELRAQLEEARRRTGPTDPMEEFMRTVLGKKR